MFFWLLFYLFFFLVSVCLGYKKGHLLAGILLGYVLGPVGAILMYLSKDKRHVECPNCQQMILRDSYICPKCKCKVRVSAV